MSNIYQNIIDNKKAGKKQFSLLIDPDKISGKDLLKLIDLSQQASVDFIFVGGSLLSNGTLDACVKVIKDHSNIPVVLFPGDHLHYSSYTDAILFLSLISGRNPEMLIGKHVISAPLLKKSGIEILPTGYMLIESGRPTSVSYMSNTTPIPSNKNDIAVCTAIAGELLGLKLIFMDAGSGALNSITEGMIAEVSKNISVPLIIGGGIRTPEKAALNCRAGADVIVVGNALEKDSSLLFEMADAVHANHLTF
jgi:putative glycerol-1-phosphate prenyltransferase